ncbi:MAG: serine hydrolase domain-containing protein [Halioglobus sp.]
MSEINKRIDNGLYIGMVIGIIDDEGERYFSFGKTSLESAQAPDKNTVFTVGSISKTFAATILADMVLRGEMSYTRPIKHYLPKYVQVPVRGEQEITAWHLITHTSGLPRKPENLVPGDLSSGYANYSVERAYEALSDASLSFDTGSDIQYSSFGVGLLAHILTLQSGQTWEELLSERVTDILAMPSTSSVLSPQIESRLAQGYSFPMTTDAHVHMVFPTAGSVKSTAKDMLRYLAANMELYDSTLSKTMRSTHKVQFEKGAVPGAKQGLGWWVMEDNIIHSGMTHGYRSFVGFNRNKMRGIVVLSNSSTYIQDIAMRLLNPDWELWDSKPPLSIALYRDIETLGPEVSLKKFTQLSKDELAAYYINFDGLIDTAFYYLDSSRQQTGIEVLQFTTALFPDSSSAFNYLAEAYENIGDETNAEISYQKAREAMSRSM